MNKNQKLVTVASTGPIRELGGITGPIINPTPMDKSTILRLINGHKKVYEVNPSNTSERVLLTLANLNRENYPQKPVSPKANVGPIMTSSTINTKKESKPQSPTTKPESVKTNTETPKTDKVGNVKNDTKGDFAKK